MRQTERDGTGGHDEGSSTAISQRAVQMASENGSDASIVQQLQKPAAWLRFDIPVVAWFVGILHKRRVVHEDDGGESAGSGQFFFQKAPHGLFGAKAAAEDRRIKANHPNTGPLPDKERGPAAHLKTGHTKRTERGLVLFAWN